MVNLPFSKGEYGFNLTIPIQNYDGSVKILTDYTVTFCMKEVVSGTVKVNSAGFVVGDPTLGIVGYTVKSTDFNTVGQYYFGVILTKTGDQEETTPLVNTITIKLSAGS